MLSTAEAVAELAALALFIGTFLMWCAILDQCRGVGLVACVFGG